jgi:putative ABC transport system permease protein
LEEKLYQIQAQKKVIFLVFEVEQESLKMAFDSIKERKVRSILTALGIIIGIAAIIALVSIGTGTSAAISNALGSLGANTIFVTGGGGGGGFGAPSSTTSLVNKDLNAINAIKGIDVAVGISVASKSATFKQETKRLSFFGVDTKQAEKFFKELGVVQLDQGRYFRQGEKHVVVIGNGIAQKSYKDPLKVGDKLTVGNEKITVIGIIKETGSQTYDNIIIAPLDDVADDPNNPQYTIIFARVISIDKINEIAANIQKKMDDLHGKKSFTVYTSKQLTEQIGTVTNTLSLTLGGIAGIALVVAGIGIANTMLMSVMERTREIGIMKAIGASNRNVLEIFLMEAILVGLFGGIIGDILGIGFSDVLGIILQNYGLSFSTKVTADLLLIGLGFSVGVGAIFGLLPARKAARMNPIEALRYE